MKTLRFLPLIAALAAGGALAPGCDVEDTTTGDEQNIAETKGIFGDDRVADVLKKDLKKVPRTFQEFEVLFKVGRHCARTDSKEIFVVEESSSRATGEQVETDALMPRAIVTGCNTGAIENAEKNYGSFSLMAALFASPDAPAAAAGDPMVFDRVEVMALDRKTGLYNFYVMTPSADPAAPGTLERVQLQPDGQVVVYKKDPKKKKVEKRIDATGACHNCHRNMGPLFNEMHEPWTNWLSTHKTLPAENNLTGETADVVANASFANDLEPIMVDAIRVWNEGQADVASSGFVQATIDGDQPNGLAGLLKSAFCETELQYTSSFSTMPMELFVDPGAVQGGNFQPVGSYSSNVFPVLMPVRAEMDRRIEQALIKKKVISLNTSIAIRLVDDKADVFSQKRCGVYLPAIAALPDDATLVNAHLRAHLRTNVDALYPAGSTREYASALLNDAITTDALKAARTKYLADALKAYQADGAKVTTKKGRDELTDRSQRRKDAARAMFASDANPMPLLEDETKGL